MERSFKNCFELLDGDVLERAPVFRCIVCELIGDAVVIHLRGHGHAHAVATLVQ